MTPRIAIVLGLIIIFFAGIVMNEGKINDTRPLITKVPPRGTPR